MPYANFMIVIKKIINRVHFIASNRLIHMHCSIFGLNTEDSVFKVLGFFHGFISTILLLKSLRVNNFKNVSGFNEQSNHIILLRLRVLRNLYNT